MYKLFYTLLLLSYVHLLAGQCPSGDIQFTNQAEIDDFVAMYPNCTEISGDLRISFSTDLSGLINITSIGGDLRINLNLELSSLTGLDNITTVGGDMEIAADTVLTDLTGLNNLTSVGGGLTITGNNGLIDLTGLNNLTTIGEGFYLSNDALSSLTGLNNLTTIGGYLEIVANPALTDLTGLNNLTSIGGYLGIFANNSLTNFTGLSSLNAIGEFLSIMQNATLTDLTGLQNIDPGTFSSSGLIIGNNPLLANCAIESICAYLDVDTNTANITGNATGCATREEVEAACIPEVEGDFMFTSQAELDDFLVTHPNFTQLNGSLSIGDGQSDTDINDLSGLINLTGISGDLYLFFNSDLHSLQGLNNLSQIGGGLFVFRNENLLDLSGLERLANIEGDFYSLLNSSLTAFTGLDMLSQVGGFLAVRNNDALADFSGLESLINIGDFLAIRDNDALTSLEGIANLNGSTLDRLYITNNPLLSNCEIESICTYLAIETNSAQIANNAFGCNTRVQVSNACAASAGMEGLELPEGQVGSFSMPQVPLAQRLQLYPNPTNGLLQLRQGEDVQSLIVLSPQGQQLIRYNKPGTELDLSELPPGVYYLSFFTATEQVTRKVVKVD